MRIFFGMVWTFVIVFVAVVVASQVATIGAGDDPALRKQMAEQSGATIGPWVLLGSIGLSIVLGGMGLLPGTRRLRR